MLSYRTAGESHGAAMIALVEGVPAGLALDEAEINAVLRRRQGGFGRGGRMKIEQDAIEVLSGVRNGVTIGSPIALRITNKDHRIDTSPAVHRPRPGHADFPGAMKWQTVDCRPVIERASARDTVARAAAGALAKQLLRPFGVDVVGFVVQIGTVHASVPADSDAATLMAAREASDVYCPDGAASAGMREAIQEAKEARDTVGGVVEVRAFGLPPGLGSCARWQDKLDGRLMAAVGSVPAIKAVEIGLGIECAERLGSLVHDEMDYDASQRAAASVGFVRRSNNAGGIEGGMTNGMPVVLRAAMKPISTLLRGLDSVNLKTLRAERSDYERSDICAVPAASVVAECVVAFEIARALLEKFGGDTLGEALSARDRYLAQLRSMQTTP